MKNNRGVTLAELVISLTLIGMVLIIGINLFFFGEKMFSSTNNAYQLQSPIRLTESFITEEVRNATSISIVSVPITPQPGYNYIYLKDQKVSHYSGGRTTDITEAIMVDQKIFKVKKDSNGRNFLSVTLKGSISGDTYEINTDILLNNISNQAEAEGKAIKYSKP